MGGDLMAGGWDVPGYTGVKVLGSGGFGEVVLARHDASGTLVAIKYLRGELVADAGFSALFRAEAAVLASLDDPNVVRLYEYVESPAGAAIVMELVDGVCLRDILARQGKTTAEAALVVLQGSLLGLAAAHRRGVVHRDYKPENVLIDGAGASKLTDFGIAARTGDSAVPAGSLRYAPPEQFGGAPGTPHLLWVPDRSAAVHRGPRGGTALPASVPAGAAGAGPRTAAAAGGRRAGQRSPRPAGRRDRAGRRAAGGRGRRLRAGLGEPGPVRAGRGGTAAGRAVAIGRAGRRAGQHRAPDPPAPPAPPRAYRRGQGRGHGRRGGRGCRRSGGCHPAQAHRARDT